MKRLILILVMLAAPVWALDPSEMLSDPALEKRARALDFEIRCVKCQSEAIASSNADWAKDARRAVREMIGGGATDAEVKAFFVQRYGEVVLMEPNASGANLLLWLAGPAMLIAGVGIGGVYIRRRNAATPDTVLSEDEEAQLAEILKK
jgi:cytochrome c-type biogenesis protein CcmH